MTTNHESPLDGNYDQPLSDELQARFDVVLRNTAEQLELNPNCLPDETVFITEDAAFGKFSQDKLTVTHTVINDKKSRGRDPVIKHYGTISFTCADNPNESFSVKRIPKYTNNRWFSEDQFMYYSSLNLLDAFERYWPIADDNAPRVDIRELISQEKDTTSELPSVSAKRIMEFLEDYTLRRDTGDHSFQMKWKYRDLNAGTVNGKMREQAVALTVVSDQRDSLRQIGMSTTVTLEGVDAPVTYFVHSDELGSVTVTAGIFNAATNERDPYPVNDPENVLDTSMRILQKLVQAKIPKA